MITNANLLKQFLLGNLSEEERDRVESEYFSDGDRFEQLEAAENELIDSYVRGELSEGEQQHFRLQYLNSPQGRSKVDFARSLNEVAHNNPSRLLEENEQGWWGRWLRLEEMSRWPRFAIVYAGFTIVLAYGALLLIQNRELRQELRKQEAANAKLRETQEASARQDARLGSLSSQSAVKSQSEQHAMVERPLLPNESLTLVPSVLRGGKETEPTLVLPIGVVWVRITLVLEENEQDFRSFDAELQLVGTQEVPLKISGQAIAKGSDTTTVILNVPARSIRRGYYTVTLYGVGGDSTRNEVGSYSFRAK